MYMEVRTITKSGSLIDPNTLDSHQQRKRRRVIAFAKVLKDRQQVEYKRFLAEMQYLGLRKQVAEEYIEMLTDLGRIRTENGYIIWNEESMEV